jgi:hypothetical protein
MWRRLSSNSLLKSHIQRVKFHWCGSEAHQGISALRECNIKELNVAVSKITGNDVTRREDELQRYFSRPKKKGTTDFPEALGWDELIALRGMTTVTVTDCPKRIATHRPYAELSGLERYLNDHVTRPKPSE